MMSSVARMEPTGRREAPPDDGLRAIRDNEYSRLHPRISQGLHPGYMLGMAMMYAVNSPASPS